MSTLELAFAEVLLERPSSFKSITFRGETWDLSHLDPFAFFFEIEPSFFETVVVFFSCHCFTHGFAHDMRPRSAIPDDEIYDDGREQRVLSPGRYAISRRVLRICSCRRWPSGALFCADSHQRNFVTFETIDENGAAAVYGVFFEVSRSKTRKCRLILQVQSAYVLDAGLTKRQSTAKKVTLRSILLAALEGRHIRP